MRVDTLRSLGVARSAYERLRPGLPVWVDVHDGELVRRNQTASDRRTALAYIDGLIEMERSRRGRADPLATLAAGRKAPPWDGGER